MKKDDVPVDSPSTEEIRLVQEIIQEIQKSKKQMRMYPPNNPMYIKASTTLHGKFKNYFDLKPDLLLIIDKYEISYNQEPVYTSQQKVDNLALFFFKDGIRLLSFRRGLTLEEIQDFVNILNVDFEAEVLDDDVVTILWERDFENIKYVVDENFLSDWDMPERETIQDNAIQSAFADGLTKDKTAPDISVTINDADRRYIANEIERHGQPKIQKVIAILFEALTHSRDMEDTKRITGFIQDTLFFCIEHGDFYNAAHTLNMLAKSKSGQPGIAESGMLDEINKAINSKEFADEIMKVLESNAVIDGNDFLSYTNHLSSAVIPHFMNILGEIQKMKSRRLLIDTLSKLARHNIEALAKGLHDEKWYVARNAAMILGTIASPETVPYLVDSLQHEDQRVRKEVVRALGYTRSPAVIEHLQHSLQDPNFHVRSAAAKAMGSISTDDAKQILLREMESGAFLLKDINEKKEFFTALATWRDGDIREFMINLLNSTKILKRSKHDESRACAAYAIGLLKDKDAVPALEKACKSSNKLLRRFASDALRKLKDPVS